VEREIVEENFEKKRKKKHEKILRKEKTDKIRETIKKK
jgi:hypothetical protein